MSFQWLINNAEAISIDRLRTVASTQSRSGVIRNISRGGQVWRFEIKLPDGPRWTDIRTEISKLEALDRVTPATFQFNNTGHSWLVGYQGNSANITGFIGNWVKGTTTINLTTSPTTSSGFKFRAGDIIQTNAGSGKVYTVASDVPFNSNTVTVHRPIYEETGSSFLYVAQNCIFTAICTEFPSWTLFARDQVAWNGSFVLYESLA